MTRHIPMTAALFLAGTTLAAAQVSWDADANGALDPTEFVNGFGNLDVFSRFDASADGMLDAAEWNGGLGSVGEYANMDLNGDGGVDAIEFNALLFNRYDGDGSGTVDAEEIARIEADLAEDGLFAR